MNNDEIMKLGANCASKTMSWGLGGPFGAVVTKGDEIVSIASNTVLKDNDPTAHAEVNAIRLACKNLHTYDLTGCTIYATGAPCPMCMSAIMWANIKEVYVSGRPEDAEKIGFRDNFMYQFIENKCSDDSVVSIKYVDRQIAMDLYTKYAEDNRIIY